MQEHTSPGPPVNPLNSPGTIFRIKPERGSRNDPHQATNHYVMPLQFSIYAFAQVTGKLIREKIHGEHHQEIGYRQQVF